MEGVWCPNINDIDIRVMVDFFVAAVDFGRLLRTVFLSEGSTSFCVRGSDSLHDMVDLCVWAGKHQIGYIPGSYLPRGFERLVESQTSKWESWAHTQDTPADGWKFTVLGHGGHGVDIVRIRE